MEFINVFNFLCEFVMVFLGSVSLFIIIYIPIAWIVSKIKRNEKVYWNEKEQQIMTKDGKCRYHKSLVDMTRKKVSEQQVRIDMLNKQAAITANIHTELRRDTTTLQTQLKCAVKGHDMVYDRIVTRSETQLSVMVISGTEGWRGAENTMGYVFKCSNCGLEITKTKKELKPKEAEALKKLNLLERK